MTSDSPFRHLAPYFHQDLDVVHGTIENAVATAAVELKPEARKDVHDFAAKLVQESEILLKLDAECGKAGFDIYFIGEVGARNFLRLLEAEMGPK
jgi:hypothetical protein